MRSSSLITCSIALTIASFAARADAPAFMPVQGYLTDDAGGPIEGAHDLRMRLYTTDVDGTAVHDELLEDVSIVEGLFSVELGTAAALDLGLFEAQSTLFLGITIDDDVELAPRITLGTVPWAAFANRAGDARTLDGVTVEELRRVDVAISFTELVDVPPEVTAGDTDTLGGLSCIGGDIPFFDGAAWTCLPLANNACNAGDVVTGFDANGAIICDPPVDTGVRGRSCPANQFMTGIAADGSPTCSTVDGVVRTYINTNCFIYVGWSDDCEGTCITADKAGRINQTTCQDDLAANSDDNTCQTQNFGGFNVDTLGINFNGDVDGNDKLFVGLRCF